MMSTRSDHTPWIRILLVAAYVALLAGAVAQAEEAKPRPTRELRKDLQQTERELEKIQNLKRQFHSAGRESSNSKRQKLVEELREHMGECIIRRENDLGLEHTIKMHGQAVESGTTEAAEVGAPVGTSRSKQMKNLNAMDGPNADRLRQLAAMQSLYVSATKLERSAVEKQGEAYESYLAKVDRFEQELAGGRRALDAELAEREPAPPVDGETESDEGQDEG